MLEKAILRSHLKLSVASIPCFKEAKILAWSAYQNQTWKAKKGEKKKKGVLSKYPENKYLHKETMTMSKHSIGQV